MLEAVIGKPVVTSTQAFLWKLLRVAGIRDQISGYGRDPVRQAPDSQGRVAGERGVGVKRRDVGGY